MGITEKSASFLRRQEMMTTLEIPTMTEAKEQLGLPLAVIVFDQSHEELREDLGLTPPLQGAGDELWVSPSDLLIGKVCLKPPLTQKHIQALTHQGIIEIGSLIEQKFWNEMIMEKNKALADREEYLMRLFEIQKNKLITEIREQEQLKYFEQMDNIRKYFQNTIQNILEETAEQLRTQEEKLNAEYDDMNAMWKEKLDTTVKQAVEKITEEFLVKLGMQEELLVNIFKKQIEALELKKKCAVEFERTKCRESLMQLKHNLECRNVANLMYILCKERRKCQTEKNILENKYIEDVKQQKKLVKSKTNTIKKLTAIKNNKTKQLNVREKCLIEIIRQYQKLITFTLRAVPTQGEFLISMQRLLNFELGNYCISKGKSVKSIPKTTNDKTEFDHIVDDDFQQLVMSRQADEEDEFDDTVEESDVLPAFYFNNKMYVREDFRDMLLQDVQMSKKHKLWNKDVEELINVFKDSLHKDPEESGFQVIPKKSQLSNVRFDGDDKSLPESITPIVNVEKSVQTIIKSSSNSPINSVIISNVDNPPIKDNNEVINCNMNPTNAIKRGSTTQSCGHAVESRRTLLLGANDSVEMLKESHLSTGSANEIKKSFRRQMSNQPSDIVSLKREPPSHRSSLKNKEFDDFENLTDTVQRRRVNSSKTQSKLALARDSIILKISSTERKSLMNISKASEENSQKAVSIKSMDILMESTDNVDQNSESSSIQAEKTSRLLLVQDSLEIIKSTTKVGLLKGKETPTKSKSMKNAGKSQKTGQPSKQKSQQRDKKRVFKVVGDRSGRHYSQSPQQFTNERISSLVNLIKDDPSLIRLFTACSK